MILPFLRKVEFSRVLQWATARFESLVAIEKVCRDRVLGLCARQGFPRATERARVRWTDACGDRPPTVPRL